MSELQSIANPCSVCEKNPTEHVVCVPGMPVSMGYCVPCLQANAQPWGILVAGTACNGGLAHCANWWKDMVDDTIRYLDRPDYTMETFEAAVKKSMEEMP